MKNFFILCTLFCAFVSLAASKDKQSDQKTQQIEQLFAAVNSNNTDTVQSLLDGNADVNATNGPGAIRALEKAVFEDKIPMIDLLLRNKANVNTTDQYHATPLNYAVTLTRNIDVVRLLLLNKADVNTHKILNDGWSNKNNATQTNEKNLTDIFNLLIEFGARPPENQNYSNARNDLEKHAAYLEAHPPRHVVDYKAHLAPKLTGFLPVKVLTHLIASYVYEKNLDIVVAFNQTDADETVAARNRAFDELML